MEQHRIISRDPEVMNGALVFAGTRVPVETLLVYLRKGKRIDDFRDDFPTVEREQAEGLLQIIERDLASA